jgi:hypothetical protein
MKLGLAALLLLSYLIVPSSVLAAPPQPELQAIDPSTLQLDNGPSDATGPASSGAFNNTPI